MENFTLKTLDQKKSRLAYMSQDAACMYTSHYFQYNLEFLLLNIELLRYYNVDQNFGNKHLALSHSRLDDKDILMQSYN